MNGFQFNGDVGTVEGTLGRVIAQVELPPGYYIIFAKVELARDSYTDHPELPFWATLELGGIKDVFRSKFVNDDYHPNDQDALITLNIAGEVKKTTYARLVVSSGQATKDPGNYIRVINPRLSAIQVSKLKISSGFMDIAYEIDSGNLLNVGRKTSDFKSKKSPK